MWTHGVQGLKSLRLCCILLQVVRFYNFCSLLYSPMVIFVACVASGPWDRPSFLRYHLVPRPGFEKLCHHTTLVSLAWRFVCPCCMSSADDGVSKPLFFGRMCKIGATIIRHANVTSKDRDEHERVACRGTLFSLRILRSA